MVYRRKSIPLSEQVLQCLRDGLESSAEIADETWHSQAAVLGTLSRLISLGLVEREARPTYYLNGTAAQPSYRHRLARRERDKQTA